MSQNSNLVRAKTDGSLAAVFHAPGLPLELRYVRLPELLSPRAALVRVTCCTLCGSDLSTLAGHRQEPTPCILGHEIIGVVEEVGEVPPTDLRGKTLAPGDRVVWSVVAACDQCRACQRGLPQKCLHLKKYGHSQLSEPWMLSGGLAEHCHLIPGTQAVVVDPSLPDEVLCPASCATATVAAALRSAGELADARVLILGAGLLGLTACAMAKKQQAQSVTVCDVAADRLALAEAFGADQTVLWERVDALRAGKKFDIILEMSGSVQAIQVALHLAEVGASLILVGSVRPSPNFEINPEQIVRKVLSIRGVHNYRPEDLLKAIDFLGSGGREFPFAEIVSQQFRLTEVNRAVSFSQSNAAIRIAVKP